MTEMDGCDKALELKRGGKTVIDGREVDLLELIGQFSPEAMLILMDCGSFSSGSDEVDAPVIVQFNEDGPLCYPLRKENNMYVLNGAPYDPYH